jgi:hypothetical protein
LPMVPYKGVVRQLVINRASSPKKQLNDQTRWPDGQEVHAGAISPYPNGYSLPYLVNIEV